ncbi:uncharacterized protein LOC107611299 [Arachis ipaensis]|uniref:uncharacterized protein LOC107611299 n=1 Tax=Arachis ipaensis TaxID=130454 RepID=UPI0007AF42BD|nr:uncharacterized protein LOC107611299 [Arachis ipaensis]
MGRRLVIAIVGMEDVGKITLAQLVYNNVDVDSNFDLKIWISVSLEYNIERVTRSIVECACRKKVKLSDLESIQMRLEEILNGKKFLIVLDGFWDEDEYNWDVLYLPFRVAARGSRVLVTTRSMLVSRIVATASPYQYHFQTSSDEYCEKYSGVSAASLRARVKTKVLDKEWSSSKAEKTFSDVIMADEVGNVAIDQYMQVVGLRLASLGHSREKKHIKAANEKSDLKLKEELYLRNARVAEVEAKLAEVEKELTLTKENYSKEVEDVKKKEADLSSMSARMIELTSKLKEMEKSKQGKIVQDGVMVEDDGAAEQGDENVE